MFLLVVLAGHLVGGGCAAAMGRHIGDDDVVGEYLVVGSRR